MPTLKIDNQTIDVPAGSTVLDAAEKLGIRIPTICYERDFGHFTSCMVCVVRNTASGRLMPACSVRVVDGMTVETTSPDVLDARRAALELLLSEHVGDCEGPCHRACPAGMNIPVMIRQIAAGDWAGAIRTIKTDIPLPATLGRICPAPCEKACRRGKRNMPVAICLLKRAAADRDLATATPFAPSCAPPTGKRIAIVGAGPAGLSAAYYARQLGHSCALYDQRDAPGGGLRDVPEDQLPAQVLTAEIANIAALGCAYRLLTHIDGPGLEALRADYDAVVLALGPIQRDTAEALGLRASERGIAADRSTHETDLPGVFAGGDAVHPRRMAVAAVAAGKSLARAVDQHLTGKPVVGIPTRFNSHLGRLQDGELDTFLAAPEVSAAPRAEPDPGPDAGLTESQARAEAERCLHCDCRKADNCELRDLADEYLAGPDAPARRFRSDDRPPFRQIRQHASVIYEPGKCIKCGICVRLTEKCGEPLGLTFVGRGFDVHVGTPFNEPLSEALQKVADQCVAACPTGALAASEA